MHSTCAAADNDDKVGLLPDTGATTKAADPHENVKLVCGIPLTCIQSRMRFLVLCTGAIGSAVGFAALQEGVWNVPGYKFSGYMTLITAGTMAVCGQIERLATGDTERRGPLLSYAKLSVLTLGGMYFTNWALKFLNYPTRVLFKSSKLVPTMIMGTLIQGRTYSILEYLAAGLLVLGVALFTLGDAEQRPDFHPMGIGLITLGVACDAATSNYEERAFFRASPPSSQPEVVTYASAFGFVWALLLLLPTDELQKAIAHSTDHPDALIMLVVSSVCGYVSVSFVLLLINLYGATVTELVKSMRKVLTVVLSFVLYPKPVSQKYLMGGVAVLISLVATHELQRRKGGDVKASDQPVEPGAKESLLDNEPKGDVSKSESEAEP